MTKTQLSLVALLAVAAPALGQVRDKPITVIPINFQNDTSQPKTIAQIQAMVDPVVVGSLGDFLKDATSGAYRLVPTVLPRYFTLAGNKGCTVPGGDWATLARQAATNAGYTLSGLVVTYAPGLNQQCSHMDRLDLLMHGGFIGEWTTQFMWSLGLGLEVQWVCRNASGAYVAFDVSCSSPQRTFQSVAGQGLGVLSCTERQGLGILPANRLLTFETAPATPQTFTLASLEGTWPDGTTQCASIVAMTLTSPVFGDFVQRLTLEYHAGTKWGDWEQGGIAAHQFSRLIDFSPDGKFYLAPGGSNVLTPGRSYTFPNGLTVTAGPETATGITVTISNGPLPAPPAGPCQAGVTVKSDDGAVWTLGSPEGGNSPNFAVLRNGVRVSGNVASFLYRDGVLYGTTVPLWWRRSSTSINGSWQQVPAPLPCDQQPPPPPTWTLVPGTIERSSAAEEWRLCPTGQPCFISILKP